MDKGLKEEKRKNRYSDRVIKQVQSYGYGKNNKYKSKPEAVCYGLFNGGDFVSYKASKLLTKIRKIRYYICIQLKSEIKEALLAKSTKKILKIIDDEIEERKKSVSGDLDCDRPFDTGALRSLSFLRYKIMKEVNL